MICFTESYCSALHDTPVLYTALQCSHHAPAGDWSSSYVTLPYSARSAVTGSTRAARQAGMAAAAITSGSVARNTPR
jgi:hypothetical protein